MAMTTSTDRMTSRRDRVVLGLAQRLAGFALARHRLGAR